MVMHEVFLFLYVTLLPSFYTNSNAHNEDEDDFGICACSIDSKKAFPLCFQASSRRHHHHQCYHELVQGGTCDSEFFPITITTPSLDHFICKLLIVLNIISSLVFA